MKFNINVEFYLSVVVGISDEGIHHVLPECLIKIEIGAFKIV
jgi:hypothetical protein